MPGFPNWSDEAVSKVASFLISGKDERIADAGSAVAEMTKYGIDGYNKFLDKDKYPAIAPPWGTLNAINLETGEYAWKIPFGEFPELASKGMRNTGSENYGGPVVTAGDCSSSARRITIISFGPMTRIRASCCGRRN
jgi:quinoprotein glucose dehydrogenase